MRQKGGERICKCGGGGDFGYKYKARRGMERAGYNVRKIETGAEIFAETEGWIRRRFIGEGGKYQRQRKWREVFEKRQTLD
jgi:hypothetical protein